MHRKAIEIDPNHAEACSSLGAVLQKQDHFKQVVEVYRKA